MTFINICSFPGSAGYCVLRDFVPSTDLAVIFLIVVQFLCTLLITVSELKYLCIEIDPDGKIVLAG
jgi:hypothetical protein